MYKTNNEGIARCNYVRKNDAQIFIFMPIVHIFLILLIYLSVGSKSMIGFYFILAWLVGLLIFYFWSTFRQLNRQNRTITEIDPIGENIIIKTNKILWVKAREYNVLKNNLQIKNRKFDWYGTKIEKEGLLITISRIELYLVKDYFDEYDEIIKILNEKQ